VLGELPRRENVPFKFASIAQAIPAEEGSWLLASMVALFLVLGFYPHHVA
jgi:hypothetical protein